ncbi:hypothetical protein HT574_01775 [Parageobacillus sp. VR-IP]|uniref:hypothetical protein n=1 Tax=Parageobacillus sp. VR-IP TaxID=2742205 RepID=UPI0015841521|nr:hypothetical protein [Parageobacillus sp. VR-IP]NUK28859.1 hypothetical protein [Parageobacillus sp. VR-IP]
MKRTWWKEALYIRYIDAVFTTRTEMVLAICRELSKLWHIPRLYGKRAVYLCIHT